MTATVTISGADVLEEQNAALNAATRSRISIPESYINSEKSYIRVVHTVAYQDNDPGCYLFSTDANWLVMPEMRGTDSIGSCYQDGTVDFTSRSGYYKYTVKNINMITGATNASNKKVNLTSSKFNDANANGGFYGSVGLVSLPSDTEMNATYTVNVDYEAHYEYKGHLRHPSLETYFNSIGTYSHNYVTLTVNPTIEISLTPGLNLGATIGIVKGSENTSAGGEVHYIP